MFLAKESDIWFIVSHVCIKNKTGTVRGFYKYGCFFYQGPQKCVETIGRKRLCRHIIYFYLIVFGHFVLVFFVKANRNRQFKTVKNSSFYQMLGKSGVSVTIYNFVPNFYVLPEELSKGVILYIATKNGKKSTSLLKHTEMRS